MFLILEEQENIDNVEVLTKKRRRKSHLGESVVECIDPKTTGMVIYEMCLLSGARDSLRDHNQK